MQFNTHNLDRLSLRQIDPAVMDYVFGNYSDVELLTFLGLGSKEELAKEKSKWTNGLTTHNRSFLYFQLISPSTNEIIGWCGYHTWYTDHDRTEIGYGLFREDEKRKGLMSEAVKFILNYGFKEMNLHRIEAMASSKNVASLRVLEKFNFTQEGVLKEHYLIDGVYEDSLVFSLLKSNN